jgi:hypothetical protein
MMPGQSLRRSAPFPPGDPRLVNLYRFQFWAFLVRHGLGILLFIYLTQLAFRAETSPIGWALLLFGAAYGGFALVNVRKLYTAWKKNEALRRQNAAPARAEK